MSQRSRKEYIALMRHRYARAGKLRRSALLAETCEVCGYDRKYAIKLLNGRVVRRHGRRGRKRGYDDIIEPLKTIWMLSEQLCGKRLKPALPQWLPHYERHRGPLSDEQREKLLRISPAQIDRLLAPARLAQPAKAKTPKPGSLLLCPGDPAVGRFSPSARSAGLAGNRHRGPLRRRYVGRFRLVGHLHLSLFGLDGKPRDLAAQPLGPRGADPRCRSLDSLRPGRTRLRQRHR